MTSQINFHQARFSLSAPSLRECPPENGAEVAFAGRSNAGKSSAINTLTRNSKLARTSKTPGRTRLINFFTLSDHQRLVDLPGYGYARVSREMKEEWQRHLSEYLQSRQSLRGLVLLMDIRHPLQDFDTTMLRWAHQSQMPIHILLTKADKLSRGAAAKTLTTVRNSLKTFPTVSIQCFSAHNRSGIEELETVLNRWLSLEDTSEPENGE